MGVGSNLLAELKATFRKHFLTGLLVTVPLGITFFVVRFFVYKMAQLLTFLPEAYHPQTYIPFPVPGLGLILTLLAIYLIFREFGHANPSEALVGLFVFLIISFILLTIVGIFFRGANMALVLPWAL